MGNNPYADPYVPGFVGQRPRIQPAPATASRYNPNVYGQIQPVAGFDGARDFATNRLSPNSSAIIAESDPNLARIYVVAKDQNGGILVTGYDLKPIVEPKPITMQDISAQLNDIQSRLMKLEENSTDDKPVRNAYTTDEPPITTTNSGEQSELPSIASVY